MLTRFLAAALLCALFIAPVEARQRHKPAPQLAPECFTIMPCEGAVRPSGGFLDGVRSIRVTMKRERIASISLTAASRVIGGRPAGCPSRFCGCGASLHLFGRIIPTLNLAANWLRFRYWPASTRLSGSRWPHRPFQVKRLFASGKPHSGFRHKPLNGFDDIRPVQNLKQLLNGLFGILRAGLNVGRQDEMGFPHCVKRQFFVG